MRSSKLMTRLSLLVAIGWSTAGLADTYVTIANNTGDTLVINNTRFLGQQQAVWSPLDVTIKRDEVFNVRISDTGQHCGRGRWIIRTAGQYRGRHAQTDYCLPLAFAEVGCLAVLVDRDGIQMNKTRGTHCSDTWWKNNRKYVFEVVSAAAQVRGKRGR